MDFSSLLDSATSSLKEIYTGPSGWQIAGIVIGAIWLVVQIYFAVIRYMNA